MLKSCVQPSQEPPFVTSRFDPTNKELRIKNIQHVQAQLAKKPDLVLTVINVESPGDLHAQPAIIRLGFPNVWKLTHPKEPQEYQYIRTLKSKCCVELDTRSLRSHGPALHKVSQLFREGEYLRDPRFFDDLNVEDTQLGYINRISGYQLRKRLEFVFGRTAIDAWFEQRELFDEQIWLYHEYGLKLPENDSLERTFKQRIDEACLAVYEAGLVGITNQEEMWQLLKLGRSGTNDLIDEFAATLMSKGNYDKARAAQGVINREIAKLNKLGISTDEFWDSFAQFVVQLYQAFQKGR